MTMIKTIFKASTLLGFASLAACADIDESIDGSSEPILNGTTVTADSLGTPRLSLPGGLCSSTMLSDQWLLTAHHCVTNESVTTGGTPVNAAAITATMLNGASATGAQVFLHPSVDVALVRLNGSLLNAAGRPFANPLYLGNASSLVPGPLFCQGWGRNTFTGGSGVLRSAVLTVSSANSASYQIRPNSSGQIQFLGDSGSSCFFTVDGVPRVTGVQSTVDTDSNQVSDANLVSVDAFRDWAEGIMGNAATVFQHNNFAGRAQALLPGGPNAGRYDFFQLLVGNDVVSSLTVPSQWSLNLFRNSGFNDLLQTFTLTAAGVPGSINDRTSSATVSGGVVLYQHVSLQSPLTTLDHGGRFTFSGSTDGAISSLTVPMGWRVQLFDGANFSGTSVTFNEGTYLSVGSFNDLASSAIVEEPVAVYVDTNFNGGVGRLLPGCYGVNALGVPNDSISSIFVPSGMSVQVFRDGQLTGTTATFTSSQSSLPGFNDSISSICVTRI